MAKKPTSRRRRRLTPREREQRRQQVVKWAEETDWTIERIVAAAKERYGAAGDKNEVSRRIREARGGLKRPRRRTREAAAPLEEIPIPGSASTPIRELIERLQYQMREEGIREVRIWNERYTEVRETTHETR